MKTFSVTTFFILSTCALIFGPLVNSASAEKITGRGHVVSGLRLDQDERDRALEEAMVNLEENYIDEINNDDDLQCPEGSFVVCEVGSFHCSDIQKLGQYIVTCSYECYCS